MSSTFKHILNDTLDLRRLMLQSLRDLVEKKITPSEARSRAFLARAALDTIRIEMIAAREGLRTYPAIPLQPQGTEPIIIDGEVTS